MSAGPTTGGQRHLGATMRRDAWWLELLPVIFLLGAFGIYATLRAFEGTYYEWGPYLSPFYSPLIDPHHRWWPFSPALLILVWPGIIFLVFLWRDAFHAFFFDGHLGLGVGTLVLLFNVTLLTIYALSCHSLRHLVGGKLDCFSCAAFGGPRHRAWNWLSLLNERHMLYAWISLITVGLTDLYVRLVASGAITDLRLL